MKREYPDRPIVGVGAVIINQGRVLLVKRGSPPMLGQWTIPGGVVELGEAIRSGGVPEERDEGLRPVAAARIIAVIKLIIAGKRAGR